MREMESDRRERVFPSREGLCLVCRQDQHSVVENGMDCDKRTDRPTTEIRAIDRPSPIANRTEPIELVQLDNGTHAVGATGQEWRLRGGEGRVRVR